MTQQNTVVGAFLFYLGLCLATFIFRFLALPTTGISSGEKFIWSRFLRLYPLHFFIIMLFLPMFLYVDLHYNQLSDALWHGTIVLSLLQAWWPSGGGYWNSPAWFLSVIFFCSALFPVVRLWVY